MARTRGAQITMSEEAVEEFLGTSWSGVLGSIGPTGVPHLATVSYGLVDGRIVFSSYGRSQKIVNLQRDPRLSFLVEDLAEDYGSIRGVLLRGTAEVIPEGEPLRIAMESIISHSRANGRASSGDSLKPQVVAKRVGISIQVEKTISWDHRALGGVY